MAERFDRQGSQEFSTLSPILPPFDLALYEAIHDDQTYIETWLKVRDLKTESPPGVSYLRGQWSLLVRGPRGPLRRLRHGVGDCAGGSGPNLESDDGSANGCVD